MKDLPKGATVYVSNNPAEQGRFLKFFVDEGLIKLKKALRLKTLNLVISKRIKKISNLITNNQPNTYQNLPKSKADAVIINSNYAIDQKLSPKKTQLP